MDLPVKAIAVLCKLLARNTLETRHHRRLLILHSLCSGGQRRTARHLGQARSTVERWYKRALLIAEHLAKESLLPSGERLELWFMQIVQDRPRSGRPPTYTAEQHCQILALAVRKPSEFGLPVEEWTNRELALIAEREQIAFGISQRTIGRMLNDVDLRPHHIKYWENPKIEDEATFQAEVQKICDVYRSAVERFEEGSHTVCIDEKTGIQALERIHPDKPIRPGKPALLEFEYKRHGTQTLIPTFEVATGQIVVAHVGPTRNEADFAAVVADTVSTDPDAEWVFVADQLNTHKSETLVRFVAEQIGFEEELGRKGHHGILETLPSREIFLADPSHRIRFVYTPKHCSWLNQIEIWFSILSRRALRRASFASLEELRDRILQFVDYFNETMARAFKWTYRGKALNA